MLAALRARVNELQINGERFDEFAGLPRGYLSKLIGARPIRRVGMTSLSPLMNALGLRCLFVEDPDGTARLKSRLKPRNPSFVRVMPAAAGLVFYAANVEADSPARWQSADDAAHVPTAQRARQEGCSRALETRRVMSATQSPLYLQ
jgi:hypothetical protein